MGIYDRQYYRDEPRRPGISSWSSVTTLIVINVAVYIADQFSPVVEVVYPGGRMVGHWLDIYGGLWSNIFRQPWHVWQLVTYGFLHDPDSIMHILFNMFALWLFGRDVEGIYGKREFYRLYMSLVVISGLGWAALQNIHAPREFTMAVGASGAVMGIMAIYIFHFPHRIFLIYGVIPMPAWVMGIIYVGLDIAGATGAVQGATPVANTAHLTGALFGFIYYRTHWTLFSLWPGSWFSGMKRRQSKYRVYEGERDGERTDPRRLKQQVDDILDKINREGEASLTADERRTLEEESRRLRRQGK
jgi:membrane associated rhomboid family serine protease